MARREGRTESERTGGEHEALHADEDGRMNLAGRTSKDEDRRFPEMAGKVPRGLETPCSRWVGLRVLLIVAK